MCGKNGRFELTNYPALSGLKITSTPLQLWCAGAEAAGQGVEVPGGGEEEQGEL